jgi:tetratricopeptide (TPR) repeat protein
MVSFADMARFGALLVLAGVPSATWGAGFENLIAGGVPEESILRSGRTFAWIRALEADAAQRPASADVHAALAVGYYLLGQRRFSREEIQQALTLDAHSVQTNYIAGRIDMEVDKNYQAAIPRFRAVLRVAKDNFKAHYFLGVCLRSLGEPMQALEQFRAAAAAAPYDWPVVAIAEVELDRGDSKAALEYARKACDMNRSAENLVLAGKAMSALGRSTEAVRYFEQAAKSDPDWEMPHYLLARIYAKAPGGALQAQTERQKFRELRYAAQ